MTDQPMTPEEFDALVVEFEMTQDNVARIFARTELCAAYRALWDAWQAANNDGLRQHGGAYDPDEIATHFPYAAWLVNRHLDHVTGPASAVNEADSDAWELSRRECPCKDCKGKGSLTCDECGVTERE